MPRNLSAWIDLTIHLIIMLVLIGVLASYNCYVAGIAFVLWVCLASFARERCRDRSRRFERYCRNIVENVNEMVNYAVEELPQAIIVVNEDGRLQWANDRVKDIMGQDIAQDTDVKEVWPDIIIGPIWGATGEYVFPHDEKFYHVFYRPVALPPHQPPLMAMYMQDVTAEQRLRNAYAASRTVLAYIQIDNFDEVMQGLGEAERTQLLLAVNQTIDTWMQGLGGFMRRVSEELYIAVLDRAALDRAIKTKFDVLDKVRQLQSAKTRLPVTLSMGVAAADSQTMAELGSEAQSGLDLALGRGGDQVAVGIGGKTQFFGGKAKAVEKHTRVRARVVAHAMREIIDGSDEVFIMGHHNEDFDCFGAAMGVAKMARQLGKKAHIVLSDMNEGIDKFAGLLKGEAEYEGLFTRAEDVDQMTALNPVLIVVDTHIPHLVASPTLLSRIHQTIVIDHHRRSETFIKNPLLVYIEPASSSTSELVTELLMYFDDDLRLSRLDATALYSGIVVDTKNFAVQTGVRTFDAAAYLRRSGADPVVVRHLFRTDYETTVALAEAESRARLYDGGLIVTTCPDIRPNGQIMAAQVADSLLSIDGVRMSIVVARISADTISLSARSTGELNVQVIMEAFGGGGHQNVAGAQVRGGELDLEDIKEKAVSISQKYIEENDKDESDTAAGR